MSNEQESDRQQPDHGDEAYVQGDTKQAQADSGNSGGDDTDEQDLVDRDKIDFDPDDGLYSGTAVDGTSDIPGPHEEGDDVEGSGPPENEDEYQAKERAEADDQSADGNQSGDDPDGDRSD